MRTGINKRRGTERWKGETEEIWAEILITQKLLITGEPSHFAILLLNVKKKHIALSIIFPNLRCEAISLRNILISMTVG